MSSLFPRSTIERIILKSVLGRPCQTYWDNKIYYTPSKIEELILSNLKSGACARTLPEFEEAMQNPNVQSIFIGKYAAITSKGLQKILQRNGLSKTIYCAFSVADLA